MERFPTERVSYTQNFPFPENGEVVYENPVTFIWIPVDEANRSYSVRLYDSDNNLIETLISTVSYVTSGTRLEAGDYYWTVETDGYLMREMYKFTVSKDALFFDRPTAREVFDAVPDVRPRHLFFDGDIEEIKNFHKTELECLERNVKMALERQKPTRPMFHRDEKALPYREYFGAYRDVCDRDLVALSEYYALTGNTTAGNKAKEILFEICDWNPNGPCSVFGDYGDEVGLSNARCLPAVFDLLYPLLDDKQRKYVAQTVAAYAKQCKDRIDAINYAVNPSNSHVGRLPGYLGEAALVLKGTGVEKEETLLCWLETALDIYCGIFPFYGTNDGSWAEGMFYGSSYTKWFLPFFSAVERYTGKSLMNRPFYHKFSNFLVHFCNPDYEVHPFGDGYWSHPKSEEWPGFFAQNPYRVYASKFGGRLARERLEKLSEQDYYRLHLLDLFLPCEKVESHFTKEAENVEVFPDGGFAALHTDIESDNDICVLARASRFGADSHRHADQGSFALFCGGTCMVSPSGYFGRSYGTKHHFLWTRSTKAHNALLIDGIGQPTWDTDPENIIKSKGKIVSCDKDNKAVILDMSDAYPATSLTKWLRLVEIKDGAVEITDTVEALQPVEVTYPLHFLSKPCSQGLTLSLERNGKKLTVTPLSGDFTQLELSDKYDTDLNEGEPEEYSVKMPAQYHAYYKTDKKKQHVIKVRFDIGAE